MRCELTPGRLIIRPVELGGLIIITNNRNDNGDAKSSGKASPSKRSHSLAICGDTGCEGPRFEWP